ncbi:MAG TPA: EthD domain-containing protein [Holophagaceae bacterium]|nr:EthD domain-containing protein [Holophagaceae bacterium]
MVKFVQCMQRKQGTSVQEFRAWWGIYLEKSAEVAKAMGALRMTADAALLVPENMEIRTARGTGEPYDGIVTIWMKDASPFETLKTDPALQPLWEEVLREQREGLDLERSSFFMVQEVFRREW